MKASDRHGVSSILIGNLHFSLSGNLKFFVKLRLIFFRSGRDIGHGTYGTWESWGEGTTEQNALLKHGGKTIIIRNRTIERSFF